MPTKLKVLVAAVAVLGGSFTYSSIAQANHADVTTATPKAGCRGGVQEAVQVATNDAPLNLNLGPAWTPIAQVAQVVPAADQDLFVVTLSSQTSLINATAGDHAEVRLTVNGNPLVFRPHGPNTFLGLNPAGVAANLTVQNAATWCARMGPGNYTIVAEGRLIDVGGIGASANVDDTAFHLEVSN